MLTGEVRLGHRSCDSVRGSGSRLWPASTLGRPAFHRSARRPHPLFQQIAVRRMEAVAGAAAPVVVTGAANAAEVRRQMLRASAGRRGDHRTHGQGLSAPALLAASLWIARQTPDAIVVTVASDHHIPDVEAFARGVEAAAVAASAGAIVTFGVRPTYPATGFGYIRPGGAPWTSEAASGRSSSSSKSPMSAPQARSWRWAACGTAVTSSSAPA